MQILSTAAASAAAVAADQSWHICTSARGLTHPEWSKISFPGRPNQSQSEGFSTFILLRGLHFPAVLILFFYATITTQHRQCIQCQDRTWRKRVQKTKWKQVLFYINMPIFNCCFLLPSYGLLAKPELTLKDGNSGVLSHTFLLSFFRWEEPQDRMQRNMRRNTLLHGLILHRLKTLLSQREKFYPSKGFTNG